MSPVYLVRYDTNSYGSAMEQASLLRRRRFTEADMENIAEEIDSMGRSEKRELIIISCRNRGASGEDAVARALFRRDCNSCR